MLKLADPYSLLIYLASSLTKRAKKFKHDLWCHVCLKCNNQVWLTFFVYFAYLSFFVFLYFILCGEIKITITKGKQGRQFPPGRRRQGSGKQPHQNSFTHEPKTEYHKVCWTSQKLPIATKLRYFGYQLVYSFRHSYSTPLFSGASRQKNLLPSSYFSSVRFAARSVFTSLCPHSPTLQSYCPFPPLSDLPSYYDSILLVNGFVNFATSCKTWSTVYSQVSCYSLVKKDEYIIYYAYTLVQCHYCW